PLRWVRSSGLVTGRRRGSDQHAPQRNARVVGSIFRRSTSMRSFIKYALVGTALAASGGAYADVTLPAGGNGQAILFVKNETTGAVYARGLNLFMDNVAPSASQIVGDTYTGGTSLASADTSFNVSNTTINADGNLFGGSGFLNS